MSFCDILASIWCLFTWGIFIYHPREELFFHSYPDWMCYMLGMLAEFSVVATCCWYSVIAYCVYDSLENFHRDENNIKFERHHAFVWSITGLCFIVPLILNKYGESEEHECWIKDSRYWGLFPYSIVAVLYLFVVVLLSSSLYKLSKNKAGNFAIYMRIVGFIIVF
eukprot:UN23498